MLFKLQSISCLITNPHFNHSNSFAILQTIVIIILSIQLSCSTTVSIVYNTTSQIAYQNGNINPIFMQPNNKFSCSNIYTFTYNQSLIQQQTNQPYYITIANITNDINISIISLHNQIQPTINTTFCKYIDQNEKCIIQVKNNCNNKKSSDCLKLSISGLPQLYYNVICDAQVIFSPFQYGLVILVIFSVVQIIICSKFQQANSYANKGHYINLLTIGLFCISMLIGQILIIVQIPYSTTSATYICMGVAMLFGVFGTMACVSQYVYWLEIGVFRKFVMIGKLKIRLMDVIGFIIGVGIVCAWYFSNKNWIISNIIYLMIFLSIIKFIKLDSLKMATLTFVCVAICNILFILLTQLVLHVYFNDIILYIFNNPLFIFCPCINFIPNQHCSWFFITSLTYPGILLSYLDRFDYSRSSKIYSIVFVVCFIVCSIIWIIVSGFAPFTLPFDLINSPICIILLCIFANRRDQFESLWNGQIFDQKHKNKIEQQNQLKSSLKQDRSDTYKSDLFKIKFSNISGSSVQAARKQFQFQLKHVQSQRMESYRERTERMERNQDIDIKQIGNNNNNNGNQRNRQNTAKSFQVDNNQKFRHSN